MKTKKFLFIIYNFFLVLLFVNISVKSKENSNLKYYIDFNSKFEYDKIIVVLTNDESLKLRSYSEQDFEEIKCNKVFSLTEKTEKIINSVEKNNYTFEGNDIKEKISKEKFHQMLCICLSESTIENLVYSIKALANRDEIEYICPNYLFDECQTIPNDDKYNESQNQRWGQELIDLPNAWDINKNSKDILIGIIDYGIYGSHEDLTDNIFSDYNCEISNGNVTQVNFPNYEANHATAIAGIIGARGDNEIGICGICWETNLVSLKLGTGATSINTISAIDYATENNISILNISFYISGNFDSVAYSVSNYPGLVVCSAGNSNQNNDLNDHYPSNIDVSNLIAVGSCNSLDQKSSFSNYGQNSVDLFAPGSSIYTTWYSTQYRSVDGTSFAAPFVAGVAALIYGIRPNLSATVVKKILLESCDKSSNYENICVSGGRLNAYKALKYASEVETFSGDVNGDGYKDLIMSSQKNGKRMLITSLGNSNGTLSNQVITYTNNNFYYDDPAYVGDFNGDGRTDILIHWKYNTYRQLLVYIGNSNGSFSQGVNLSSTRHHSPIYYPNNMLVMDQNGDGYDDFVVMYRKSNNKKAILTYFGKSTTPYLNDAPTDNLVSNYDYDLSEQIFKGDFNGDGKDDILVQGKYTSNNDYFRKLFIYKSNGNSFSEASVLNSFRNANYYNYPSKFFVSDINNDGKDDFVVHFKKYNFRHSLTYLGTSNSPYILEANNYSLSSNNRYIEEDPVFVGDFNGDGYNDILVHWENDNLYRRLMVYYGDSSGNFGNRYIFLSNDICECYSIYYVLDINNDGKDDFVVKQKASNDKVIFKIYLSNNNGFSSWISLNTDIMYFS